MADYYNDLDRALAQYGYDRNEPKQYSRPTVYSPFQNQSNINDNFSYIANMYGPGAVQAFAGPDAFLMHQMPGQAPADQHAAAQHQQNIVHAVSNATERGNSEVAKKVMGFERFVNGGKPITQLDREHAETGGATFNNPLFKSMAENGVPGGREGLEGIMYGRKGDPEALARATGQIGFYRPDATGGKKMSAESMETFSTQLHNELYGDNANLDEMHGYGGYRTAEMMNALFQEGRLPQSMGSLSAADRVKALSASKRDDKTMTALAKDYAHRDMMEHDYDYASATAEARKGMLDGKVDSYKGKLETVFQEADKFKNNDPRAKSAAEIEQLSGFSTAANGIDVQRTSKVLKDYNGAIKAIQEMFGDNGKANAPVEVLMKSLNNLTAGAQTNLSPAKVESTVREIRLAAQDAGMSDDKVATLARDMHHTGQMMGLTPANVMDEIKNVINASAAMDEQGVFAKPGTGKLNKAQAEKEYSRLLQRGDASHAGNALAMLNRLSIEDADQFKGTELAAAAEAYRQGEETYTFDGKTVNLLEVAGQQGVHGLSGIAQRSSARVDQIDATFEDREGNKQYMNSGYAFGGQKYQLQQRISQVNKQKLFAKTGADDFAAKFKPAGMSDEEFSEQTHDLVAGFSGELADIVMNETADMTSDERAATMERRSKEELKGHFRSSAGGNLSEADAEKRSEEYFNQFYGDTPEKRKSAMNTAYREMNAISNRRTGLAISAHQQLRKESVQENIAMRENINEKRADRVKALSAGTETTMQQRFGEELNRLSDGDEGTRAETLARLANVMSKDKMLQKYAPDAQGALEQASKMYSESTITTSKIAKLQEAAAANPDGPEQQQLIELAGYEKGHKLTEDEQRSLVTKAHMRSGGTAAGTTATERETNKARQQRADILFKAFNTGNKDDVSAGATALAQEMLGDRAGKKAVQEFADAALAENPREFERAISGMSDEQQEAARSTAGFLRASQKIGGLEGAGLQQSGETVDAAAERPTARTNAFKANISRGLKAKLRQETNNSAYKKLRRETFGSDTEMGRIKGEAVADQLSKIMTDVVVDDMGGAENVTPAARSEFIEERSKEKLAKYFEENDEADPARAKQLADKHFNALMGADKEDRQKSLEVVYATTQQEAKQQGLDAESAAARRTAAVEAERTEDAKQDATIMPAKDGTPAKYDYKKLGVTEKVTTEQQAVIDQIKRNPTAANIGELMLDEESQKLLLSLPDAAAVDLFKHFSPEEQQRGLDLIKQGAGATSNLHKVIAKQQGIDISVQDQQNLDRLHTALTKEGGLSSSNVVAPAAYEQPHAPAKDGTPAKYDYKKLGVTEKVTAEQQAVIDQIRRNPTAATMSSLMRNEESQKLLLSLPDAAAVNLFKHFSPEEQRQGLEEIKQGAGATSDLAKMIAKNTRGIDISVQDQQNLDRIHTAITKAGGLSSSNVVAPAAYEQEQATYREDGRVVQTLPRAFPPATEAEAIQEQLAAIDSRTSANWFTEGRSFATSKDETKHKELTQRQRELESGDPIGSVRQEMAEINSRKQKVYLYGESFATTEDTARYSELEGREKAILSDGGAVVQQSAAGVNAARGATASSGPAGVSSTSGAGRSTESLKVNGTLTLNGLQEVLLSAMGQRMAETPDGGAPISLGAPTGR